MPYIINRTNTDADLRITIEDNVLNTGSTSLSLPGPNYRGFGEYFNTNFVQLLENFASPNIPANPLRGQLWFDTNTSQLRVCPSDDERDSENWITLSSVASDQTTEFSKLTVNGPATFNSTVAIVNSDLSISGELGVINITASANIESNTISADVSVIPTHTMVNQIWAGANEDDVISSGTVVGTWKVKNSLSVVSANNIDSVVMNDDGIRAKNFFLDDGRNLTTILTDQVGYTNEKVYKYLSGSDATESQDGKQYNGSISVSSVTANELRSATVGSLVYGTWTLATGARFQSTYADIAERYHADDPYDVGTVVEIGGSNEVTICNTDGSNAVFGVVSNSAAHLLNNAAGDDVTHPPIALIGRVPVKVIGCVNKGDRLISAGNGCARSGSLDELSPFNVIGRALEDKTTDEVELLMTAVTMVR